MCEIWLDSWWRKDFKLKMQLLFCCFRFRPRAESISSEVHLLRLHSAFLCFLPVTLSQPTNLWWHSTAWFFYVFLASLEMQTLLSQMKIPGRQHTPTYRIRLELPHVCKLLEVVSLKFCWKVSFLLIYSRFFSRDYKFY